MRRLLFAWDDLKWSPLLPGCGTQHPLRALGGTRVLLAAAPTTPPCFRRWRRSSSLQRKDYFKFRNTGASADAPVFHFHRWGRNGKRQLQRRFLRKRGAAGKFPVDFQRAEPSQALPRQLPRRGSQAVKFITKVLGAMRKLSAVLLALPLGELSPQVTERARAVSPVTKVSDATRKLSSMPEGVRSKSLP